MIDERAARKYARKIVDTVAEMRACQNAGLFSILHRRLKRLSNQYQATGAPIDMRTVTEYGKH